MKLTIVGRGTAGLMGAAHFWKWTDWEIEVIGDPTIPPVTVGEGSQMALPILLNEAFMFRYEDLPEIGAVPKRGVDYRGWGKQDFIHDFPVGAYALHFDAGKLREYITKKLLETKRVRFTDGHVNNVEDLDADFVLDCSGTNAEKEYVEEPVNAAVIVNKPPIDSEYTLAQAMRHGWTFGIPLLERTSYGYIYNTDYATEEEAVDELYELVGECDTYTHMKLDAYHTGIQKGGRVFRSGNASHLLEPLEATALETANWINREAWDYWNKIFKTTPFNIEYENALQRVEAIINLHYLKGSVHKTPFWKNAKRIATETMKTIDEESLIKLLAVAKNEENTSSDLHPWFGGWTNISLKQNFQGLGIKQKDVKEWMAA